MLKKPVTYGKASFPLDHLESFRIAVPAKDPLENCAYLQVTFSCHVFTEKWSHDCDESLKYIDGQEIRAFCPVRYGCSIKLAELIKYHILGKAFEGRDGNGFRRHFFYAEADGITYPIFFELSKAMNIHGAHGVLHIISAYQKPNMKARHRFQSVKFARLVHTKCPP